MKSSETSHVSIYLSPAYAKVYPVEGEVAAPELYLHTDYFPMASSTFLDDKVVFNDERTTITVEEIWVALSSGCYLNDSMPVMRGKSLFRFKAPGSNLKDDRKK